MSTETPRDLVVVITHGIDHEKSTAGFVMACGGLTAGLNVAVFLTSAGVDLARRGAVAHAHVQPFEPLERLVSDFVARGGALWACTPCVQGRGLSQEDMIDGALVTGASLMFERVATGAATLSF